MYIDQSYSEYIEMLGYDWSFKVEAVSITGLQNKKYNVATLKLQTWNH